MKTKARAFALAISAAAFLAAGCDAVLEGFYPEFAKADITGTGISVFVNVQNDLIYQGGSDTATFVRVRLVPIVQKDGKQDFIDWSRVREDKSTREEFRMRGTPTPEGRGISRDFPNLGNAEWGILVWIDANDDGKIQLEEPSTLARDEKTGSDRIDFRYKPFAAKTHAFLDQYSKLDPWILGLLFAGDDGGTNTPPTAYIADYPQQADVGQEVFFRGQWMDDEGWVAQWEWTIHSYNFTTYSYDLFDGPRTLNNDGFKFAFGQEGSFRVTLRVQDNKGAWSPPTEAFIEIKQGFVAKKINVSGSNQTSAYQHYPVRFILLDRWSKTELRRIDTYDVSFANAFFDVPDGSFYAYAWVDADYDWVLDPGEPGAAALNKYEAWRVETIDARQVGYVDFWEGGPTEATFDFVIGDGSTVPPSLATASGEAATGTSYSVGVEASAQYYDPRPSLAGRSVRFRMLAPDGSQAPGTSDYNRTLDGSAYFYDGNLTGPINYHAFPGQDRLQAVVDANADAVYGNAGDYMAEKQIFLQSGNSSVQIVFHEWDWIPAP